MWGKMEETARKKDPSPRGDADRGVEEQKKSDVVTPVGDNKVKLKCGHSVKTNSSAMWNMKEMRSCWCIFCFQRVPVITEGAK